MFLSKKSLKFIKKTSFHNYLLLIFLTIIFTLIFNPSLFSDSSTFIKMDKSRSPIYPIFLNLNKFVFGKYFLNFVIFFQFFIYFFSVQYFLKRLYMILNFNLIGFSIAIFFLILPSFYFGNSILSESLSFSFFLLFLGEFIYYFKTKKQSSMFKLFILFICCALTKPQFLFIFGVLIYLSLFTFLRNKKKGMIFFFGTIFSLIFIFSFNKTYHYVLHKKFETDTNLGSQFVVMPIFLTTSKLTEVIKNDDQKVFLASVFQDLKSKNINFDYESNKNKSRQYWIKLYLENYAQVVSSINFNFDKLNTDLNQNRFLVDLSFELLRINFKKDPRSVLEGYFFNSAINGYYWIYLAICFLFFTFILCIVTLVSKRISVMSLTLTIFSLAHLLNIMLVALIEPVINRYRFFTEVPLLVIIVILLFHSINVEKNKLNLLSQKKLI